jgi:hypothetical protein
MNKNKTNSQLESGQTLLSISRSGKHQEMYETIRKINNIHREARAARHAKFQAENRRYFDYLEIWDANQESTLYKFYQHYTRFNELGIYVSNEYKYYLCYAVNTVLALHKKRKHTLAYAMMEYLIRYTAKYIKQADSTFRLVPSAYWNNVMKQRLIVLHKNIKKYKFVKRHNDAVNIEDIASVLSLISDKCNGDTIEELPISLICEYYKIDEPSLYNSDLLEIQLQQQSDVFINDQIVDEPVQPVLHLDTVLPDNAITESEHEDEYVNNSESE